MPDVMICQKTHANAIDCSRGQCVFGKEKLGRDEKSSSFREELFKSCF